MSLVSAALDILKTKTRQLGSDEISKVSFIIVRLHCTHINELIRQLNNAEFEN